MTPISECMEVAETLAPAARSFDDALHIVRAAMDGESETVISAVAWALWLRSRRARAVAALPPTLRA